MWLLMSCIGCCVDVMFVWLFAFLLLTDVLIVLICCTVAFVVVYLCVVLTVVRL